jgi:hypothetical protein
MPHVTEWLALNLKSGHPKARITTADTHKTELSSFLRAKNLNRRFSDSDAYEIQVDVTGIVEGRDFVKLAFVECKIGPITLRDVGQLLGYSLIAKPEWSYLLSPAGLSNRLSMLLVTYGRQDVLLYGKNKYIRTAAWNLDRCEIDIPTLLPKGSF